MPAARPAIYVASLTDYNNGILHGRWIDALLSPAEIHRQIHEMLAGSPTTTRTGEPAEEWAIHDHEGFGDVRLDAHESVDDIGAACSIESDTVHGAD